MKKAFKKNLLKSTLFLILFILIFGITNSQNRNDTVAGIPVNYDETAVGSYTLPDVLTMQNGKKVITSEDWISKRRPEILDLYETEQFGKCPDRPPRGFTIFDKGTPVFDGKAIRKQITLYFTGDTAKHRADLLLYLPAEQKKPSPVLLCINFTANALFTNDPGVRHGMVWNRDGTRIPDTESRRFGSFEVEKFISQGIGVAAIYYGDIEPDFAKGIPHGIRGHFLKPGEKWPARDEWGTISAWAWGLGYAMDYLETEKMVNAKQVALFGISRLGKTVLWAGARDQRFGMVIASCSGEGGAALSYRNYGETIKHMTDSTRYFYQFAGNRSKYGDHPETSPIDAHMLISLIAPRPLLLQTGTTDYWSDPKGEFMAAVAASPVYKLFGKRALETSEMPKAGVSILHDLGYFMHEGGHGTLPTDYDVFISFIKKHFPEK